MTSSRQGTAAILACAAVTAIQGAAPAHADQINPDRPGIGSDPQTVPQFTFEAELGTDDKEFRLGILKGFEIDRDDTSWGAKLALIDSRKLQMSVKLSYDRDLKTVIEAPASIIFSSWFYLGTDVIWSRSSQTYAGEFNFTPTKQLTITPTLYYEGKTRAAIFVAWIPPGHDNIQFDIGYDQHKVSLGISGAIDFAKLLKHR